MKVHILPLAGARARSVNRVNKKLFFYAPDHIEPWPHPDTADLVIIPVIGRQDHVRRYTEQYRNFAIIQYSVRRTKRPSTEGWQPIWNKSWITWSYLDLNRLCKEDGVSTDYPFYFAPLGVDNQVFRPTNQPKSFIAFNEGSSWVTESTREIVLAAERANKPVLHLGPSFPSSWVMSFSNVKDSDLVTYYGQCEYVTGLRRTEGFEMTVAEGLLCGLRPIVFSKPHYRHWYGRWAEFITEGPREQVIDELEVLFKAGARPVTDDEIGQAKQLFNWERIIKGFWKECLR